MKNIYEYLDESEVIENACLLAAQCLIENGLQVIPIDRLSKNKQSTKEIKSVSALKQNPLHLLNYAYYFNRDGVDIAIMLTKSMEVIDIDEKHYKGITKKLLAAIEQGWPELYEKLCISRTPSGGAHLYYYAEIVGGDPVLAKKHADPNPIAFIERIDETNKNYIKTAPSEGYFFTQRNPLELSRLSAEERNWLICLCQSFNEVVVPEVKKADVKRDDSPWNIFNKAKDWTYIISELQDRGWESVMDLPDRVVVNRPGSSQRHSGSVWKESARLYLFSSASEFEPAKAYSPFGIYCHYYHDGNVFLASKQLAAEGYGLDITTEGQFWRKEGKKIVVKYTELVNWAVAIGYYRYENEIVQVINNRVRIAEIGDIKTAFLKEVEPDMADHFYERVSTIFAEGGGFMAMLPKLEPSFLRDQAKVTWLFYLNCAVKITPDGPQQILYNQLDGLIWENSIINRKYYPIDYTGCDAQKFIKILGGTNYEKLQQIIGYALSRYKDPMIAKAIVLMEDIDADNEGESQGRSGKGLVFQIIRQFRKAAQLNGKSLSFQDTFLWQNVELDTDLIFIDDVEKTFSFTKLYSIITDGILVNKKGVKQVMIPYSDSPKLFITSNFAVGSMDDSAKDRKFEFPVVKHFSSRYKPIKEFGRAFFTGWPEDEWNKFDCYLASCAQSYLLLSDSNEISVTTDNSVDRSLQHDTSKEFVEFMDDQLQSNFFLFAPNILKTATVKEGGQVITNAVNLLTFASHQHDADYYLVISKTELLEKISIATKFKALTMATLTRWMKKWAETRQVKMDFAYKRTSTGTRQFRVEWWPLLGTTDFKSWNDDTPPF